MITKVLVEKPTKKNFAHQNTIFNAAPELYQPHHNRNLNSIINTEFMPFGGFNQI